MSCLLWLLQKAISVQIFLVVETITTYINIICICSVNGLYEHIQNVSINTICTMREQEIWNVTSYIMIACTYTHFFLQCLQYIAY